MNIKNIIIGIILIAIGIIFVWQTEWFVNNFGRIGFFEEKMGYGYSRFGYKLIGIILIILGVLVVSGLWSGIFMGLFGQFFGGLSNS